MTETRIHPSAIVDPDAELADDVVIGPWSYVGPGVKIGQGTRVESHVVLKGPTTIGKNNHIYQFSSVGEDTPDLKYNGEPTRLTVGDNNVIRECVTIHRGTVQDNSETVIGSDNLLMAYVHVGHDCVIGSHCILVNNAALAGHVYVDDWAILGGYTMVHQFCRVGSHCFTGMGAAIGKDVLPFVMVAGHPAEAKTINSEGLRRRGFEKSEIALINKAFKTIFRKNLTVDEAVSELSVAAEESIHVSAMIEALKESSRGIVR